LYDDTPVVLEKGGVGVESDHAYISKDHVDNDQCMKSRGGFTGDQTTAGQNTWSGPEMENKMENLNDCNVVETHKKDRLPTNFVMGGKNHNTGLKEKSVGRAKRSKARSIKNNLANKNMNLDAVNLHNSVGIQLPDGPQKENVDQTLGPEVPNIPPGGGVGGENQGECGGPNTSNPHSGLYLAPQWLNDGRSWSQQGLVKNPQNTKTCVPSDNDHKIDVKDSDDTVTQSHDTATLGG
jgi:hypothetical protein